jgi:DNA-directed RNA polymerase subunit beta'
VKFSNVSVAKKKDGTLIVMNRNGEIIVTDEQGRERERYGVVYGAKLLVRDGQKLEPNSMLAEWDPYSSPILTEVAGRVKYGDLIDGVTISEQVDEITGLARKVVIASKDPDARPRISIKDEEGKTRKLANSEADARYMLPEGANLVVNDGDELDAGDALAKMPRETTKTKDITGGLPRVAELFEARKPK